MRILFKYPTRGRPDWFKATLQKYFDMLSGKHDYKFIIAMDNNDEFMNNEDMRKYLSLKGGNVLEYFYRDHRNKIHACNTGIPDTGWDILILVSDDMIPITHGFDDIIAEDMKREFPDLDGALHYNDGYAGKELLTYSVMGIGLYRRIGFVYWPAYQGTWCDNDFMDTAKNFGKYCHSEQQIIRHEWQKHGIDPTYQKGEATYKADKEVYDWRKSKGFPVSFSQNDEDWIIRNYFKDRYEGRFLDIGAGDGFTFSNTKILYDMGFNGVCVEPSPNLMAAMKAVLSPQRVKFVEAALVPESGPVDMWHSPGFLSTTNEQHKTLWQNSQNVPFDKMTVKGISWTSLMLDHGNDYDFVNLDIEGENINMLKLMPDAFKQTTKMFCIEYDNQIETVKNILCPFGYNVIHTNGENVILVK